VRKNPLLLGLVLVCSTTAFAQVPAPYFTDFELEINCGTTQTSVCNLLTPGWLNIPNGAGDNINWLSDSGGTSSTATGPGGATTGQLDAVPGTTTGKYLYLETSGVAFQTARVRSPLFDMAGVTAPRVRWFYHMLGATMGTMHLDLTERLNGAADGDIGSVNATTFVSLTSNFTANHVGHLINITSGLSIGTYTIASINSPTSVELTVAPAGGVESGVSFTHEVSTSNVIPSFTDNVNLWQEKVAALSGALLRDGTSDLFYVEIRGLTGSSFTSDMAIDAFTYEDTPAFDAEVVSIDSLGTSSCVGFQPVTVTIKNNGVMTLTSVPLDLVVDAGLPISEAYTGSIPNGGTDTYTFTVMADLTAAGAHTVDVTAIVAGDSDPSNDSASIVTNSLPLVTSLPYSEDFEGGMGGWASGGTASTWAFGTPAKTVIIGAASGVNCWVSGGLTGDYVNSENSFVVGPCFDLSGTFNPFISLNVWWNCEFSFDGAVLQTSIDGGQTWQNVGAFGDPNNWYTDNTLVGTPGGSMEGWSGRNSTSNGSGGWVTAFHALDGLAGQSQVIIRIAFGTDGSVIDDGFAFDDILIDDAGPPPFPGTGHDIQMATGVNGIATSGIGQWVKSTVAGDILTATVTSPGGTLDFQLLVAGMEAFFTAGSPPVPFALPGVHISLSAIFLTQISPLTSVVVPAGNTWSFQTPVGLSGVSVIIQGVVVSALALPLGYGTTDGYVWEIL
jgi:hypothetical protein